jgi:hypothetical protein
MIRLSSHSRAQVPTPRLPPSPTKFILPLLRTLPNLPWLVSHYEEKKISKGIPVKLLHAIRGGSCMHIAVLYAFLLCAEMKDGERESVWIYRVSTLCTRTLLWGQWGWQVANVNSELEFPHTIEQICKVVRYIQCSLTQKSTAESKLSEAVTILNCIREVPGSILS